MVTWRALVLSLVSLTPACTTLVSKPEPPQPPTPVGSGWLSGHISPPPPASYPGSGFVVHEWGTDTVVVGSDGSLQRGLHHEEEDLPGFVYNRLTAGSLSGSTSVEVKMETPVTYFYSDVPRSVNASVAFPEGVFTQWYPAVRQFAPRIIGPNATPNIHAFADPVFDPSVPLTSQACIATYRAITNGSLDWGQVDIGARDAVVAFPTAPLDTFSWSYARQVASNPVHVVGAPGAENGQDEKFLFYRGLGSFALPVAVTADAKAGITIANHYAAAIPRAFLIRVGADGATTKGAFNVSGGAIAPDGTLTGLPPDLATGSDLDTFSSALGDEVTAALDGTGLYHDEAVAMVNTWKRHWFRTPGVRVLYLIPQAWTDASIPLTITPAPDKLVRMMMIRVEVITPELEETDYLNAQDLADPSTAPGAEAYFASLGRFEEPRLRRALSLLQNPPYADAFLASIATVDTNAATGE